MEKIAERARIIRIAALTALFGNALLAFVKIAAGFLAGSLAVAGDGIDSSMDVLIAIMSLIVAGMISSPADEEHPWGHGRAETIATSLLSCILFFAGAQLVLKSVSSLLTGIQHEVPGRPALYATLFSIGGKLIMAWTQYSLGKKAGSAMLRANAKNMTGDVILSGGVLLGLVLSMISGIGIIDSIVAILVGIWVMKSAVGIFMEANAELMDGSTQEFYLTVFEAVRSVPEAGNPHRTRMRRIAGLWDIDIDIEVAPNKTVLEAHWIAHRVEQAIKEQLDGVYDIMIHVEPAGNEEEEGYGLAEKNQE
ncbi:MAG: cation diffusion facilitator family transporter [Treponema sp.]|jgi:cation diffusion facilitator family transporter|nr:cation diffusion facilitator family transporter [Treponema sp.]